MKALRYGISSMFVAGFALIAACGGSTDDGGDAVGGKSAGGRSGANAGAGGRFSGGGGATNNSECPATAPADATACTITNAQMSCAYAGARCTCERTRGGGMMGGSATRQWQCTETLVCPATKPTVGGACTPAQGNCRYDGMGSCSCSAQTSTWACQNGGTMGGFGGFPGGFGGFPGFGGSINGSAGASTGTNCPATKPVANGACTGTDACPYPDGGCQCMSDKWTCL